MKKIAFLLALIMTIAAVAMPIGAEDSKKYVVLYDFDQNAESMTSMTTLDKANNIDGLACFSCCTTGSTPTISAKFDAVDVSDCDYLAFWLYLEEASLAEKFTSGRIEVTSSGKAGAEDIWYPICKKDNFPDCWLPDLIEGDVKAGWNLVKLPLNVTTGTPTGDQIKVNTNAADRTKINYFRIYGTNSALANKTIKVDTLFAYQEGAVIPEPQKTTPAVKDPLFVNVFDFDTVTASSAGYDTPVIDTENHLNGKGCYSLKTDPNGTHPNIPILEAKFDPVDISGCDYLCFWLYLESADLATKFASGRIELNSSGVHNEKTDLYVVTGNASGYPNSVIANLIEGGAKAGWNLVKIPLNTSLDNSAFKVYHDNADRTNINYFRLQCTANALIGKEIKLDYMFAYTEGTEIPAPQKFVPKDPLFVNIFDFDTVTASSAGYDTPVIDTENHLNGEGCYTLKTDPDGANAKNANVPLLEAKFDAVDISKCDYLCFWLYLESADLATQFTSGRIELNSSGVHNETTDIWIATGNASAWPHSVIGKMIEGGAKAGWNLVKIPLDTSTFAIYHDNADRTKINYFRLYGSNANLKGKTIKIDYMYAYTDGTEIPAPMKDIATVRSASLTLKGDIGLNVKMNLPKALLSDADAYVEMQWADGSGEAHVLPVSEATTEVSASGDTRYVFTFPVPARRIYDDVNFRVFNGDGEQAVLVFSNAQTALENDTFTYAVSTYLESKKNESTDPKMVALAKALLDYGSAAMTYFDYNASEAPAFINDLSTVTAASLADYEKALSSTTVDGIRFSAASLYLQSLTAINVKFTCESGDISGYTFTCDNEVVEPVEEGGKYVVTLANIAAKDLDQMHVFSVSDGTNTQTLTYGALSFAASKLSGDSAVSNVAKTLYLYNVAADAYFAED